MAWQAVEQIIACGQASHKNKTYAVIYQINQICYNETDRGKTINLERTEAIIRTAGGLLAYATLGSILYGIWLGTLRQGGRKSGRFGSWLRSGWFYFITSALFFGLSYWGWVPLPLRLGSAIRIWFLALGIIFYFPGVSLLLWGRSALGKNYFVSTGMGAQLSAGHELVTNEPFAIVRHPMYSGLILAAWGSLLLYTTWTSLLYAVFSPFVILRACREEMTLAAEFGDNGRHTPDVSRR